MTNRTAIAVLLLLMYSSYCALIIRFDIDEYINSLPEKPCPITLDYLLEAYKNKKLSDIDPARINADKLIKEARARATGKFKASSAPATSVTSNTKSISQNPTKTSTPILPKPQALGINVDKTMALASSKYSITDIRQLRSSDIDWSKLAKQINSIPKPGQQPNTPPSTDMASISDLVKIIIVLLIIILEYLSED